MKKPLISTKHLIDGISIMESTPKIPFGNEERKKASIDLTLTYLSRYYSDWRLTKVLSIQKLLSTRYDFYKDIVHETKQWDDLDGDATIAQEIRNGLYFDAISECVQYVEDLFALLRAIQKPDFFIRNIITYDAGQVTSFIKTFKSTSASISKTFFIPPNLPFDNNDSKAKYDNGVKYLVEMIIQIIDFYKDYEFFYNQYKHGLSVAMRPLGNKYTSEQIEKDKKDEFSPYLAVFDNFDLENASKKGRFTAAQAVLMVGMTENVMPFISKLHDEKNYLRLAFPPDNPNFSINLLINQARKVRMCLHVLIVNVSHYLKPNGSIITFQLPGDHVKNEYTICTYDKGDN